MEEYLQYTKQSLLQWRDFDRVHVVVGNESCDLDSVASAVAYALYLHKTKNKDGLNSLILPVHHIKRRELCLRTDITFFLKKINLSERFLTFIDEIDLHAIKESEKLCLTLIDHNVLPQNDRELEEYVISVIDHRKQERVPAEGCRIVIDLVGSCSTLIAEEILRDEHFHLDYITAFLLYGTILADTIDLSPEFARVTPRDVAAIESLQEYLPDMDRHIVFQELQDAKFNLKGLTNNELLEKDLKMVVGDHVTIAMSSVTIHIQELLARENFVEDLSAFCDQQGVIADIIMTLSSGSGKPTERQLAIYSRSMPLLEQISDLLRSQTEPDLHLEKLSSSCQHLHVFSQGNVPASRKVVLPTIKSFVTNYKAENALDTIDTFGCNDMKKDGTIVENATASAASLVDVSMGTPDQFSPLSVNGSTGIESSSNQTTDFDWQSTTTENTSNSQANGHTGNDVDMVGALDMNQDAGDDVESDFHQKTDDFIDNLIDTGVVKGGNQGQTHSNLQVSSDPVSPGLESPMEFSSGHTSEHGSSYPATPPNSFMESNLESAIKDVGLPSFNSSEMVKRIRDKKKSLAQSIDMENTDDLENDNVPFTPPNSFADGNFDMLAKEQHLPSFNSSDMVSKINKKKSALSQSLSMEAESKKSERFPYTPHNSLIEGAFDMHPQDTLPSFNNAEMIGRIKKKKASLVPLDESEDVAEILDDNVDRFDSSEGEKSNFERSHQSWSAPFTPHNSFVESNNIHRMAPLQTDVEQFANQLTEKIMSGGLDDDIQSNDEMFDMNIEDESAQPSSRTSGTDTAGEYQLTPHTDTASEYQLASPTDTAGEYQLASPTDSVKKSIEKEPSPSNSRLSRTDTADEYQLVSPTDSVKEIALSMTKDIILKALDTFPTTYSAEHTDNDNKKNSTELVSNTEKEVNNSSTGGTSFQIETDYLPSLDPLGGSLDIVTSPENSTVLGTDARKVIAESASFDKMLNDGENIFRKLSEARQFNSQLSLSNEHDGNPKSKVAEFSEISTENMFKFDSSDTFRSKEDNKSSSASSSESEVTGGSVNAPESEDSDTDFSSTTTEGSYRVNDSANASPQTDRGHIMDIIKEVEDDESEVFDAKIQESNSELDNEIENKSPDQQNTMKNAASPQSPATVMRQSRDKRKEVYMTTAGRISIASDNPPEDGLSTTPSQGLENPIVIESREHVGQVLERVGSVIARADTQLIEAALTDTELIEPACADTELTEAALTDTDLIEPACADTGLTETAHADDNKLAESACLHIPLSNPASSLHALHKSTQEDSDDEEEREALMSVSEHGHSVSASSDAQVPVKGIDLRQEWQDDDIHSMEDVAMETRTKSDSSTTDSDAGIQAARPTSLSTLSDSWQKRKIVPNFDVLADDDAGSFQSSDADVLENIDSLKTPDDIATPLDYDEELEWENDTPVTSPDPIPEYTAEEEMANERHWRKVAIDDREYTIDMKVIEPYKKVLSHGGYYGDGLNAIILFSGCYLPDRSRKDYNYVMDNLFLYVISTLDLLVAEDYIMVYFHGATPRRQMPSFRWLKRCYQMIDRRMKKNLKGLMMVHPTLWLKTVVLMSRPFISSKFSAKLRFVKTLQELSKLIPMEYVFVPDIVQKYDDRYGTPSNAQTPTTPSSLYTPR